ncbi:E3 ubiquitin/ISG15 ligase TRIM25-like [Misgurnus anguillicaudatus]|uniref:E3 ubiquitin/ISG15 ligase TRIM25-like n=1 Tax=Misgurnus anguillicaudatus TaxID=75329 RepID=UPI003CCF0B6C
MAEASVSCAQDQFICSICLDLLKDPVTIPCGHSYCMSCITNCWNQNDQKRNYSCPQCRQTFNTRPDLGKNVMLAEMLGKLEKTKLQTDRFPLSDARPEDVKCDICTERKYKAIKSCLVCLESYCQTHFEQHEAFRTGKRHKVIDVTGRLQEMICSQHDKLIEVYCRTDQRCICLLCLVDEHKNHDTVSAAAERTEKQRLLEDKQRKLHQRIQEKEKKLQDLRESVKIHTEIDDLRRRNDEMEKLSQTKDHISFLQSFQSFSSSSGSPDNITVSSLFSFDDVMTSFTKLKEKMEDFCKEEIEKISDKVSFIEIIPKEPKTRAEFIQYFSLLSLDPDTSSRFICLSEENRVATHTYTDQKYPKHPDRFDGCPQVLCRESLCGRGYWEIEWSGDDGVFISVSYESISRKGVGDECGFGYNDQSWSLICSRSACSFWHNKINTNLPVVSSSCRIGVYVNHSAGILSFYSVSDTMTLIHRVNTTFTKPLYPGFGLRQRSTVKLCQQCN